MAFDSVKTALLSGLNQWTSTSFYVVKMPNFIYKTWKICFILTKNTFIFNMNKIAHHTTFFQPLWKSMYQAGFFAITVWCNGSIRVDFFVTWLIWICTSFEIPVTMDYSGNQDFCIWFVWAWQGSSHGTACRSYTLLGRPKCECSTKRWRQTCIPSKSIWNQKWELVSRDQWCVQHWSD